MSQLVTTTRSAAIVQTAQSAEIYKQIFEPLFNAAKFPARQAAFLKFKQFIDANSLSREEVTYLIHVATKGNSEAWVPFVERFERSRGGFPVFPAERQIPGPAIAPSQAEGIQEEKEEEYQLSTTIVEDVAIASTPIIIAGQSGSGKSTLNRAIIARTIKHYPDVEFLIVDLQANRYMGLQRTSDRKVLPVLEWNKELKQYPIVEHKPNTVTFVTDGNDDQMLLATEAIKQAWDVYCKRNGARQQAVMNGLEPPVFHLYRLFLNEWSTFVDWAKSYKQAENKVFIENAISRGIPNPLTPGQAVARVRTMFRSGRDNMISCCVLTQDFTATAIEISPQDQSNGTLIAVGRINHEEKTGGYDAVEAAFADQYRIRNAETRSTLRKVSQGLIKKGEPFLVSSQMYGSVGLFPDYSRYEKQTIASIYQHEII